MKHQLERATTTRKDSLLESRYLTPNFFFGNKKVFGSKPMKVDPTGRHGIGLDFMSPEEKQLVAETNQMKKPEPKQKKEVVQIPCELCGITVTSQILLISHYKGQKHQRKMKLTGSTIGSNESSIPGM